jgi:hypothetical protein
MPTDSVHAPSPARQVRQVVRALMLVWWTGARTPGLLAPTRPRRVALHLCVMC